VDINNEKYALLVKYAVSFLSIAGLLQLTDCIRLISTAALRGLKDTKIPMIISITTFWFIAFPSAYLLAFHWNFGGIGLWYGMLIGLSICAISLLIRFNILAKKIDLVSLVIKD
jgi:MATE family multidrug resistance protein